jgi:hypothetical protein
MSSYNRNSRKANNQGNPTRTSQPTRWSAPTRELKAGSVLEFRVVDGVAKVTQTGKDYTRWTIEWQGENYSLFVWDEEAAMVATGSESPKGVARYRGRIRASLKCSESKFWSIDRFDVAEHKVVRYETEEDYYNAWFDAVVDQWDARQ